MQRKILPGNGTILLLFFVVSCRETIKTAGIFQPLETSATNIRFSNKPSGKSNTTDFPGHYIGSGIATGDINNDGLTDIYFTANNKGGNKLYLNKGNFIFEDITTRANVAGTADWCTGVTTADINGDGLLDIYTSTFSGAHGLKGHNELYINNGDKTFTESAAKYKLDIAGAVLQSAFFDFDRDGDLDCFILSRPCRLFRNDLDTNGTFTDISTQAGISITNAFATGSVIADLNNDGWDDLYISNVLTKKNYYYLNNGNGTFTESYARFFMPAHEQTGAGVAIADPDNDGYPDLVTIDVLPANEKGKDNDPAMQPYPVLRKNNGGTIFPGIRLPLPLPAGIIKQAPLLADFDNDAKADLLVFSAKGKKSGAAAFLFQGNGDNTFTDMTMEWGFESSRGDYDDVSLADLDNDGNVDIIISRTNAPVLIIKNNTAPAMMVNLVFKGDSLNRFGIGAKAWIFQKGKMQFQQLHLNRALRSSAEPMLHFGLNDLRYIDSMLLVWPDQKFQIIKNIPAVGRIEIRRSEAAGSFSHEQFFRKDTIIKQPLSKN